MLPQACQEATVHIRRGEQSSRTIFHHEYWWLIAMLTGS